MLNILVRLLSIIMAAFRIYNTEIWHRKIIFTTNTVRYSTRKIYYEISNEEVQKHLVNKGILLYAVTKHEQS